MTFKYPKFQHVGQKYNDFEVTKSIEIRELQSHLIELVHLPSSARIIHLANEDPENLFCLSFQTLPESSNGVAHILEHTVLCGSKKYPVKDPFFAMNRRSLNTFMNALTGADFTCYPAATQVPKDFYNLLEVYIDAVFHPNLTELSFMQEGHRLEFAVPDDPESPLEYKGVVFNEMKGAMASPNSRLSEALHRALFPDLTYGVNSGGEPKVIPQLTFDDLKVFHAKHYHPSRCLFFFYGNMPLEDHLDFIAKNALSGVKTLPPLPQIPRQPRFLQPRTVAERYPVSAEEGVQEKTYISFGWLTCHVLEQQELLALAVLEIILLDTDASPLKKALLKSGLCKQVSSYLDPDMSEVPLVIVLRGCNPENVEELEVVLRGALETIVKEGIPLQQFENALHQLEFHRSEISGDHAPFGLSLFMRSALLKQHGARPEDGLTIHTLFEELRKRNLEDPKYFTGLIRWYILDNPHFVKLVMQPDDKLADIEAKEERDTLAAIKENLTPQQITQIIQKAKDLAKFQLKQEEEDFDILPKVTLEDVPTAARIFELKEETVGNLKVFHHGCFTNGIVYAELFYNLPMIPEQDLSYVRLFATLMAQMGCGGRNYMENLEYIQENTGGVGASLTFNLQASGKNSFHPTLCIRGKALHRNAEKLFTLMRDMATSIDFTDIPRIREVLQKQYTGLVSSLNSNALKYAINLSASGLDVASKIANEWFGLEYYWKVKEIAENFDKHAPELVAKLTELKSQLLCLKDPHLVITCDKDKYAEIKKQSFYGLKDIPVKPFTHWRGDYQVKPIPNQGRVIASPIAFIGKVFKTVPYSHPHAPALNVAAFILDNVTLHTKLREQGGAYGGGAICNSMAANFYFYSYRDPNIVSSLDAFEEAINDLVAGNFDDSDLEEAKLEMIQGLDSPISPGSRGELAYSWIREGKPHTLRQAFRDKLLALTREDVIEAVKAEIVPNYNQSSTVVFAGKELLEKQNAELIARGKPPLVIERV